jgi:hypothetical protein
VVTLISTVSVSQSCRTRIAVAVYETLNLPLGEIKLGGRVTAAQTFSNNGLNDAGPVQFFI